MERGVILDHLYAQQRRRRRVIVGVLGVTLLMCSLLSISLGQFTVSWADWHSGLSPLQRQIVMELRLPRLWCALMVGCGLAICGHVLQILLHNPVAEPGLIGVSSGAGLLAVSVLFLGFQWQLTLPAWAVNVSAFAGAALVTAVLLVLAGQGKLRGSRLLLLGMAIGIICNALTTWLIYFSNDQGLRQMITWLMGSLAASPFQMSGSWLIFVLACGWLLTQARNLQLLQLGAVQAQLLGVSWHRLQYRLLIAVCLIIGISVALTGIIGFIGLVVPHFVRLISRDTPQFTLPVSGLAGGILLAAADLIARLSIAGGELPVGVVTATVGAPVFIYLLVRRYAFA